MAGEQDGNARRGASENDWTEPHEHNVGAAGAPGASAPGEEGYEGDVQISAMGADVDQAPGAFSDPTGREDQAGDRLRSDEIPPETREAWERAERGEGKLGPEG